MDKMFLDINYGTVYRLSVDNGNAMLFFKDDAGEVDWFPHQYNGIYPSHELLTYVRKNVENGMWEEFTASQPTDTPTVKGVEMRGYVFVHRSVSGKYAGIQAAHAMIRLVHWQYANPSMISWVKDYETLVLLDGGNSDNMKNISNILCGADNAMESFQESDMDGMTTAIAYVPSEDEMNAVWFHKANKELGGSSNPVVNLLLNSRSHRG